MGDWEAGRAVAADHKRDDAASYDRVVAAFDRWSERTTAHLAEVLIERAGVAPGESVLDVGCGSGVLTRRLVQRVGERGRVAAVDHSLGMLRWTTGRGTSGPVRLGVCGDAEELPFGDREFDAVLSLFALLHFPAPHEALAEMARVLRPGGRVVLGVGLSPPITAITPAHAVRRLVQRLAVALGRRVDASRLLSLVLAAEGLDLAELPGVAGVALPAVLRSAGAVVRAVRAAGFADTRTGHLHGELSLAEPDELWELQTTFSSQARWVLESCGELQREAVRARFCERCRRVQARGGRLAYSYGAVVVLGRRLEEPTSVSR